MQGKGYPKIISENFCGRRFSLLCVGCGARTGSPQRGFVQFISLPKRRRKSARSPT